MWVPCSMRSPGMFVSVLHVAFNLYSLRHYFPECPDMHHIEQIYYNKERNGEFTKLVRFHAAHSSTAIHYHSGTLDCMLGNMRLFCWKWPCFVLGLQNYVCDSHEEEISQRFFFCFAIYLKLFKFRTFNELFR